VIFLPRPAARGASAASTAWREIAHRRKVPELPLLSARDLRPPPEWPRFTEPLDGNGLGAALELLRPSA